MTRSKLRRSSTVLLALAVAFACSKEPAAEQRAAARAGAVAKTDDSADGTVDLGSTTYHTVELLAVGSVTGTITRDGPPAADSVSVPDQRGCDTRVADTVSTNTKGLSNAIVWIADAMAGKALPLERRIALASDECSLEPRVQATVFDATVNVENDDAVLHKFVFTHLGKHDTLAVIPFFNTGEVVASERIAKTTGIVEARCAFHPWMRAYIAVFDHPYFAVTDKNGSFTIDSLPPGTYRAMVWHTGAAKPVEQPVRVVAGAGSRVDLAVRIGR